MGGSPSIFSALDELRFVLDDEHAAAVLEFRKVTKKAPLTAFGAKLLAKQLAQWPDPNEAAEIMITACWQGFKPEWVKQPQQRNGATTSSIAAAKEDLRRRIADEHGIIGQGDSDPRNAGTLLGWSPVRH